MVLNTKGINPNPSSMEQNVFRELYNDNKTFTNMKVWSLYFLDNRKKECVQSFDSESAFEGINQFFCFSKYRNHEYSLKAIGILEYSTLML